MRTIQIDLRVALRWRARQYSPIHTDILKHIVKYVQMRLRLHSIAVNAPALKPAALARQRHQATKVLKLVQE